jgi:actin-related protein
MAERTDEAEPRREEDERANELSRRFKEEQARREADQRAAREEAARRREAEERERREQERAMAEALEMHRREEAARRQEQEQRRLEEEAREREEAAARARAAVEKARKDAEAAALKAERAKAAAAKLRQQVAARIRALEIPPGSVRVRRMVVIFLVILVGAIITINFIPLDASSFESTATARLGTPVTIGRAHLETLGLPALRFEHVAIGPQGGVRIDAVRVKAGLRTLLDERKKFDVIEVEGAQVPVSWFAAGLWGQAHSNTLHVERVVARNVTLHGEAMVLPKFNMDATFDAAGSVRTLLAETPDRQQTFTIAMRHGIAGIEYSAKPFRLPFPGMGQFDDFAGSGTLSPTELRLSKFDASVLNGSLSGTARLRWGSAWTLDGEFIARSMEPGRLTGALVPSGRLEGEGTFVMRAATPGKLRDAARVDASFTVHRGTLGFADLTRVLQGSAARGGTTAFSRLDGNATLSGGSVQLRQVRLASGLLNATGDAVVDAQNKLTARIHVELTSTRIALLVGGTVAAPEVKR